MTIQNFSAARVTEEAFALAEGPVWFADRNAFVFVDIEGKAVCEWVLPEDFESDWEARIRRIPAPDRVGFIVPIDKTRVLAGVRDTLMILNLETGEFTPYLSLNLDPRLRFNDGKCGPDGTLYAGVMAIDQSDAEARAMGAFYVIRGKTIRQTIPDMAIPNGIAWSPDGKTLYHTDTPTQTIFAYAVGADGTLHDKRTALTIPADAGAPDGFCADDEGNLWIALWGGRKVRCYNTMTKELLYEISVDGENISCISFGGAARNRVLITSGTSDLDRGALFHAQLPIQGPAPFKFRLAS